MNDVTGSETSAAEQIATAVKQPTTEHVEGLLRELETAVNHAWYWRHRSDKAYDSRWCIWPGQTDEGVKRVQEGEIHARWDGASDTRIRLVDEKVREAVRVRNAAYRRADMPIRANRPLELNFEDKVQQLLRWTIDTRMRDNARIARQLANDWCLMYGLSVTLVEWERLSQYRLERVDVPAILEVFGVPLPDASQMQAVLPQDFIPLVDLVAEQDPQAADEIENALDLIINTHRQNELVDTLGHLFPSVGRKELRDAARELRETGATRLPYAGTGQNRPRWKALLPFYNCFFPADTPSLSEARWIAVREWVPVTELDDIAREEDWSDDFLKEVKETEGKVSFDGQEMRIRYGYERGRAGSTGAYGGSATSNDSQGRVEIYRFWNWAVDEYGVRGLYRTTTSRHVPRGEGKQVYASHELYDAEHGRMPFVEHTYYRDGDRLIDAVGIPWLLWTFQNEIKQARDGRIDAADISILPPLRRHISDMDTPIAIGPDMPVNETIQGTTEWMRPPDSRSFMSVEVEQSVRADAGRIVGSPEDGVPDISVTLNHEELANWWLEERADVLRLTLQLMQEHMEEETVLRVSGSIDKPFTISGDELRGEFDLRLTYDARELDDEYRMNKIGKVLELAQYDTRETIDRGKLIRLIMNEIDGHWADQVLVPTDVAAQTAIEEEKQAVAQIMTGQEPTAREDVGNARLRLNYLQGLVSGESASPALVKELQEDETKQKLYMSRMQAMQFQLQQQNNAQIGRTGVEPVLGQ